MVSENCVAYHELVSVYEYESHSRRGKSVAFRLPSRDDLKAFDNLDKKKSGAIHRLIWTDIQGNPLWSGDAWYKGTTWSASRGACAKFELDEEGYAFFTTLATADNNENPDFGYLTIFEMDEEGNLVDIKSRKRLEAAMVGVGGRAKKAVMLCGEKLFCKWLEKQFGEYGDPGDWLKKVVGIASRKELDSDEMAWARYLNLVERPYLRWKESSK